MAEPARRIRTEPSENHLRAVTERRIDSTPIERAYQILHFGFASLPIVAGLDKFLNFLAPWELYLAPIVPRITGITPQIFMLGVGFIEVIAGIGVALKPRIFGYVVSAWLAGIVVNLLLAAQYYDIALRDLGLAMGAFAMGKLAQLYDR